MSRLVTTVFDAHHFFVSSRVVSEYEDILEAFEAHFSSLMEKS